jgi:chromosome segregation ATPase
MNRGRQTVVAAGLKPSTVGPLRAILQSWANVEVTSQLRHTIDQVRQHRPTLVILPADRGAGLAACDRLRTDESLGQPLVWLLSEEGLTARVAAHWLRPSRAHLYSILPLSQAFIDSELLPLLPDPTRSVPTAVVESEPEGAPGYLPFDLNTDEYSDDPPSWKQGESSNNRLRVRLDQTREALRILEQAKGESDDKLARTRDALATAHADLNRHHDTLRRTSETNQRARLRLEELEDALDETTRSAVDQRNRTNSEIDRLRGALETSQKGLHVARDRVEVLEQQQREASLKVSKADTDRKHLVERLEELRQRESSLRQSLHVTRTATEAEARRKGDELERLQNELMRARQKVESVELESHSQRARDESELQARIDAAQSTARAKVEAVKQSAQARVEAVAVEQADAVARLKEERQQLQAKTLQLETDLEGARGEVAQARERARSEHERLQTRQEALTQELQGMQDDLRSASDESKNHLKALTTARQARAEAYTELEGAQHRWSTERSRLLEECGEARNQLEAIASGSGGVHTQLLSLTDANARLRRERDALETRTATLHTTITGLEQEGVRRQQELADLTRDRDGFRTEQDDRASAQARLQARLDVAEQETLEARNDLQASRSRSHEWSSDYEALRRERDSLREERNRLAEQHLPLVEERNRLRHELGPLRISRDQTGQALEASRARIQLLRTDLESERARTLELEVQLEQRQPIEIEWDGDTPKQQQHRALAEARVTNERLRTEQARLEDTIANFQRTRESEQTDSRELHRRLAAAELEAEEARTQQIQDLDWFMDTLRAVRKSQS